MDKSRDSDIEPLSNEWNLRVPAILLIEDDISMRSMMIDFFTKKNYPLSAASSGAEALKLIKEKRFDLVLRGYAGVWILPPMVVVSVGTNVQSGCEEVGNRFRLDEGQQLRQHSAPLVFALRATRQTSQARKIGAAQVSRGELPVGALVIQGSQAELFKVVGARGSPGRFASRLHSRQQHRDKNADDGDHHQELDQSETRWARRPATR